MTGLAAILIAAALAHALARASRVPVIPLLLLGGLALTAGGIAPPAELLRAAVELGLVVLVFAAGVELTPRRIGRRSRAVMTVGLTQFLFLGAGGWLVARLLGFDPAESLFIAGALAASSTLVVVGLLKKRQQMFESFGRLVTGILLLQDAGIVVALVVLNRIGDGPLAIAGALLATAAMGGLAWAGQRWVVPWIALHSRFDDERLLLWVLAVLFGACGLARLMGVPMVVGAFLAGVTLSGFPMNGLVRGILNSLTDFFLAVFFVALGAIIVIPPTSYLVPGIVLSVFLIVATVPLVTVIAERAGLSTRSAIESGLLLSQTSEFSLVIALQGLAAGVLDMNLFSLIALITVGTMSMTPLISHERVTDWFVRLDPRRLWRREPPLARSGHVLVLGLGTAGEQVLRWLIEHDREVVVIDEDSGVVAGLAKRGIPALQADGSSPETLSYMHAREADAVLCLLPRLQDAERVLGHLQGSRARKIVRVFEPWEGERVVSLGGSPVVTAEIGADRFQTWFTQNREDLETGRINANTAA
ncbi:MAG TPA: cation:proton antiporter [Opitutaceae bacterium]|nr:cation:proton antiporter [Opitutaceae bacterium]